MSRYSRKLASIRGVRGSKFGNSSADVMGGRRYGSFSAARPRQQIGRILARNLVVGIRPERTQQRPRANDRAAGPSGNDGIGQRQAHNGTIGVSGFPARLRLRGSPRGPRDARRRTRRRPPIGVWGACRCHLRVRSCGATLRPIHRMMAGDPNVPSPTPSGLTHSPATTRPGCASGPRGRGGGRAVLEWGRPLGADLRRDRGGRGMGISALPTAGAGCLGRRPPRIRR